MTVDNLYRVPIAFPYILYFSLDGHAGRRCLGQWQQNHNADCVESISTNYIKNTGRPDITGVGFAQDVGDTPESFR